MEQSVGSVATYRVRAQRLFYVWTYHWLRNVEHKDITRKQAEEFAISVLFTYWRELRRNPYALEWARETRDLVLHGCMPHRSSGPKEASLNISKPWCSQLHFARTEDYALKTFARFVAQGYLQASGRRIDLPSDFTYDEEYIAAFTAKIGARKSLWSKLWHIFNLITRGW